MKLHVLRFNKKNHFIVGDCVEDATMKMIVKSHYFSRVMDVCELPDGRMGIRLQHGHNNHRFMYVTSESYPEYCNGHMSDIKKHKPRFNWKNAWKFFYPEGDGKPKKGYALHHSDEKLRHNDIKRYNSWIPSDLVMITRSEHMHIHRIGKTCSEITKEHNRKRMTGNKYNMGKHWFNNGVKNIRTFSAPEGYVNGRIKRKA